MRWMKKVEKVNEVNPDSLTITHEVLSLFRDP